MREFSASYNFPSGFLWGSLPTENVPFERDGGAFARKIREKHQNAVFLTIPWKDIQRKRDAFDEARIDALRSTLTRLKTANIETLIAIDSRAVPDWLGTGKKSGENLHEAYYHFAHYLIDAVIPYTNYFSIVSLSQPSFLKYEELLKLNEEIRTYIRGISEKCRTGILLDYTENTRKGLMNRLKARDYPLPEAGQIDFAALHLDNFLTEKSRLNFSAFNCPVMVLAENYENTPETGRNDLLRDEIFELWQLYQNGCPVSGFFTDWDLDAPDAPDEIYSQICQKNALEFSTADPDLPEKWLRFLKD